MGKIISFEGIHGAGKTTQAKLMEASFKRKGYSIKYISSGDKPLSRYGMQFIEEHGKQDPKTLFYLSMANNNSLQGILKGPSDIFILDRYIHTDMASTLLAGGDINWIKTCISPLLRPDHTFFLDTPVEDAHRRKNWDTSKLENGGLQSGWSGVGFIDYQSKLREAYIELRESGEAMEWIMGGESVEKVHQDIIRRLGGIWDD